MKKKLTISLVLILVMAAALSVTAHAADLPQAIQSGGTTISITDITPREDGENEKQKAENYTVGSYYPIEVETAEDHGIQLLVKTFLVPQDTDPQTLIQTDLIRRGIAYEPTDILRQEIAGEDETKTVSQTVTMESETDDLDDILSLLNATMDYREDGFTGTLALDKSSIRTKEAGSSSYAYQMKETREFNNLDRNDLAYIPKTVEKNGVTLSLADVNWIPMASGAENSEVPSLYKAEATYTGTAYGNKADGYTITAEYTGEVIFTYQNTLVSTIKETLSMTAYEGTLVAGSFLTPYILINPLIGKDNSFIRYQQTEKLIFFSVHILFAPSGILWLSSGAR